MASCLSLEAIMKLSSVYFPVVSHDGKTLAFYWDRTGQMELYTIALPNGTPRQISRGDVPRSLRAGFIWSRDDARIVFAKDVEGNEQHDLYAIDVTTGQLTQLTNTPTAQDYPIEFSPDGQWISILSNREGQLNLYKLRADGSEAVQLTTCANPVYGGFWSPDGTRLALYTNDSSDLKNQDIYLVPSDGSRALTRVFRSLEGAQDRVVAWTPNGSDLVITSDASGVNQPGLFSLSDGTIRWLGESGLDESAAALSKNGQTLATLRNQDSSIAIVLHDLTTKQQQVLEADHGIAMWPRFALDDKAVVCARTSATRHRELELHSLARGDTKTLTPVEYGSIDPTTFVQSEHVRYPSSDGLPIPAILYKPESEKDVSMAPAIVIAHGGPTGQFMRGFDPFTQVLVNRGYVVLQPNVRGSTGYGVEFRDMNLKDWGGGDLEDIAAGVEYLKSLGFVDPNRIAIYGGSYGGYMAFMAVVKKPDLWKAGIAWIGISDLHRLYAKSMQHFKYYLRMLMGDPVEDAELWKDRSAIHFMENLKAKLLIVHGENDPRCPVEQSRIVRDRLLELGYQEGEDFEYVEFTGVGHASSDIGQKTEAYRLMLDFFERTL